MQGLSQKSLREIALAQVPAEGEECPICLGSFRKMTVAGVMIEVTRLDPCNHAFSPECAKTWNERSITCALCRQVTDFRKTIAIIGEEINITKEPVPLPQNWQELLVNSATQGQLPVVKALLDRDAEVTAGKAGEETPFYLAISKNHIAVARELYDRGAREARALTLLGNAYYLGNQTGDEANRINKDPTFARVLFSQAAELGSPWAYHNMGCIDRENKNFSEARQNLEKSTRMGLAAGYYTLGIMSQKGEGTPVDLIKALDFYELAVSQGYKKGIQGFWSLGWIHWNSWRSGQQKSKQPEEAFSCLQKYVEYAEKFKAIDNHYAQALYQLGLMCEKGFIAGGIDSAQQYYKKAVQLESPSPDALFRLACLYQRQNHALDKAQEYLELSAALKNGEACLLLGHMHEKASYGVVLELTKAREFYQRALQLKIKDAADALYHLGYRHIEANTEDKAEHVYAEVFSCFQAYTTFLESTLAKETLMTAFGKLDLGNGHLKDDLAKARKSYEEALSLGLWQAAVALHHLGWKYLQTSDNKGSCYPEAVLCFQKYIHYMEQLTDQDTKYIDTKRHLADLYKNGHGVQRDLDKAKECRKIAQVLDIKGGKYAAVLYQLGELSETGFIAGEAPSAYYYYINALMHGNNSAAAALFNLGCKLVASAQKSSQDGNTARSCLQHYVEYKNQRNDRDERYVSALCHLGTLYENAVEESRDLTKARDYYDQALQQDIHCDTAREALYRLGCRHIPAPGEGESPYAEAFLCFQKYIEYTDRLKDQLGQPDFTSNHLNYGKYYETATAVAQDLTQARQCYEKALAQGSKQAAVALYKLGNKHFVTLGGKEVSCYAEAALCFQKYVECMEQLTDQDLQYIHSHYHLAAMYRSGNGVQPDLNKAEAYDDVVQVLDRKGGKYAAVLYQLGTIYSKASITGDGANQEATRALQYFEKAATLNHQKAIAEIYSLAYAHLVLDQQQGLKSCSLEAFNCLQKFVELARDEPSQNMRILYADALLRLGEMCENGLSVARDLSKAIDFYKRSYEYGNGLAPYLLGKIYLSGVLAEGVNLTLAVQWFTQASNKRNLKADLKLGCIYLKQDLLHQARKCFIKLLPLAAVAQVAQNKLAEVDYRLGQMYRSYGKLENIKKARESFESAARNGHTLAIDALYDLGFACLKEYTDTGHWRFEEVPLLCLLNFIEYTEKQGMAEEKENYAEALRQLGELYHQLGFPFNKHPPGKADDYFEILQKALTSMDEKRATAPDDEADKHFT